MSRRSKARDSPLNPGIKWKSLYKSCLGKQKSLAGAPLRRCREGQIKTRPKRQKTQVPGWPGGRGGACAPGAGRSQGHGGQGPGPRCPSAQARLPLSAVTLVQPASLEGAAVLAFSTRDLWAESARGQLLRPLPPARLLATQ